MHSWWLPANVAQAHAHWRASTLQERALPVRRQSSSERSTHVRPGGLSSSLRAWRQRACPLASACVPSVPAGRPRRLRLRLRLRAGESDAVDQKFGGGYLGTQFRLKGAVSRSSEASTGAINNQRLAALLRLRSVRRSLAHALVHALRRRLEPQPHLVGELALVRVAAAALLQARHLVQTLVNKC